MWFDMGQDTVNDLVRKIEKASHDDVLTVIVIYNIRE